MNYPTLQVTDFLNNPKHVSDLAESLEYIKSEGGYPGSRTKPLHEIDPDLYKNINNKIIRLLFPEHNVFRNISWTSASFFQKITYEDVEFNILNKENSGKGWIHQDGSAKYTAMIYLSKGEGSGTAIYSREDGFNTTNPETKDEIDWVQVKNNYITKTKPLTLDDFSKSLNSHVKKFRTECLFNSSYNKMIAFDGATPHGAVFKLNPGEERITFITFFYEILAPYTHIAEMRRI